MWKTKAYRCSAASVLILVSIVALSACASGPRSTAETAVPPGATDLGPIPAAVATTTPPAIVSNSPPQFEPSWLQLNEYQRQRRAAADQFLYRSEVQKLVYAQHATVQRLITELKAHRYRALQSDLDKVNADFFKDARNEFGYRDVIWGFTGCDTVDLTLEKYFQAWAAAKPKSAWAHLALGMYYQAEGCNARGEGWANEVSDQQWKTMDQYLAEAWSELERARQLNPKLPPLYWTLIIHAKMIGDRNAATEAMEEAKKNVPSSYLAAVQYIDNLSPRWGGSYEQMGKFAESMLAYLDKNPRYWDLQGYAESEKGDDASRNGDSATALEHYEVALSYADYRDWLVSAAESAGDIGRLGDALALYMRNARYEKPLDIHHKAAEDDVANLCRLLPASCKIDPGSYPWYGEPGTPDSAEDNPLK